MGALNRSGGRPLTGLSVGVYGSGGAPWHHLAFSALHGATVRVVRAEDIEAGRLAEVDVLIVPGGGATAMAGLLGPLGEAGATAIRNWVEGGGSYLSSCAGSVLPLALSGEAESAIPTARCLRMVEVPMANPGDATLGGLSSPGVGRITVRVDSSHPIGSGVPESTELVHYNGPLFDLRDAPPGVRAFAWPTGTTSAFTPAEGFLPATGSQDETTVQRCIAASAATALEAPYGQGEAILFGSHPEFGLGPLCLGWGEGARLLLNALATRSARARASTGDRWGLRPSHHGVQASELASDVASELARVSERFARLEKSDTGGWLEAGCAPSFHGREAATAWREDCLAAAQAARAAASDLAQLGPLLGEEECCWLDDEPRPGQDFGAMGLTQMVERIHGRLDMAEQNLRRAPKKPLHAYDLFEEHPFQLAVGSYLSSAGLVAAALLTVAVLASESEGDMPASEGILWAGRSATSTGN